MGTPLPVCWAACHAIRLLPDVLPPTAFVAFSKKDLRMGWNAPLQSQFLSVLCAPAWAGAYIFQRRLHFTMPNISRALVVSLSKSTTVHTSPPGTLIRANGPVVGLR